MNKIAYYLEGELLGKSEVKDSSTSHDRIDVAKSIGIDYYDEFRFYGRDLEVSSKDVAFVDKSGNKHIFCDFKCIEGYFSNRELFEGLING